MTDQNQSPGVAAGGDLSASAATEVTVRRRNRFLQEMRRNANVSRACDAAGVSRQQVFALRKEDPDFRAAWDEAEAGAVDDLEEEVLRRARDGVDKPVYFGGKLCGNIRSYNDALALEILKSRRERLNARAERDDGSPAAGMADHDGLGPVDLIEERLRRFEENHPVED
ncbi:MAG TPA: hypothetical protein VKA19_09395 [Alphaproteobacteria bacterium]|nr:hypothetical protein [Alphaproteobacteria bacterium]